MGNGAGKLTVCFTGELGSTADHLRRPRRRDILEPLDDLGHSSCYIRPELAAQQLPASSKVHSDSEDPQTTTFRSISGASVSANTSTPLSTSLLYLYSYNADAVDRASAFEGSTSFSSIPLQPIPRNPSIRSGLIPNSGPVQRGFMSGPIERASMSGPLDPSVFSGPLENVSSRNFRRSYSHGGFAFRPRLRKLSLLRALKRAFSKSIITRGQNSIVAPIKGVVAMKENELVTTNSSVNYGSEFSLDEDASMVGQNLQWAQGRAGEDRVLEFFKSKLDLCIC